MGQLGFFDLNRRYESLTEKNDPLVAIAAMVPSESFRPKLHTALIKGELRRSEAERDDADRLRHDPAMRWIVGGRAAQGSAASPSQIGRCETQWLAADKNLSALADLSGQWIDRVH